MEKESPLFQKYQPAVEQSAGELFKAIEMRGVVDEVQHWITEACNTAYFKTISPVRLALGRQVWRHGVGLPTGSAYISAPFDEYEAGEPAMRFASRIIAVGAKEVGRVEKTMSKLFDEPSENHETALLLHMTFPVGTGAILSPASVNFAVVQPKSGENFVFDIRPNTNLGKVIAEQGIQNEFGDMREVYGDVDKCPLEAVPVSDTDRYAIAEELKRFRDMHVKPIEKTPSRREQVGEKIQAFGGVALQKLRLLNRTEK